MSGCTKGIHAILLLRLSLPTGAGHARDNKLILLAKDRVSEEEPHARPDYRAKGRADGGIWIIDRRADVTAVHYWNGSNTKVH
jgi:hypothetical protein